MTRSINSAVAKRPRPTKSGKIFRTTLRATKTAASAIPSSGKSRARTVRDGSKLAQLLMLLRRKEGATIDQLVKATDWQAHSVRGAISGTLKKKLGLSITANRTDGIRTYRVAG